MELSCNCGKFFETSLETKKRILRTMNIPQSVANDSKKILILDDCVCSKLTGVISSDSIYNMYLHYWRLDSVRLKITYRDDRYKKVPDIPASLQNEFHPRRRL